MSKKIKAVRMWAELPQIFTEIPQVFYQRKPRTKKPMPVAVIPATDPAALIESMAKAYCDCPSMHIEESMRYALEQHGIIPKPRVRKLPDFSKHLHKGGVEL